MGGFAVDGTGPGASVPVVALRHRSLAGNVMPTALSCFFPFKLTVLFDVLLDNQRLRTKLHSQRRYGRSGGRRRDRRRLDPQGGDWPPNFSTDAARCSLSASSTGEGIPAGLLWLLPARAVLPFAISSCLTQNGVRFSGCGQGDSHGLEDWPKRLVCRMRMEQHPVRSEVY